MANSRANARETPRRENEQRIVACLLLYLVWCAYRYRFRTFILLQRENIFYRAHYFYEFFYEFYFFSAIDNFISDDEFNADNSISNQPLRFSTFHAASRV